MAQGFSAKAFSLAPGERMLQDPAKPCIAPSVHRDAGVEFPLPRAGHVSAALLAVVAGLAGLSLTGQVSKYFLGHPQLMGFVPAFYVDYEMNVPTWYSSFALGICAALLAAIALAKIARRERFRWRWAFLAGLFLLLSVDEVAMLHEYPIDPLRAALHADGLLYYAWVLPGFVFVALLGACYLPWLWHLPRRTALWMACAAAIFLGGALGVEMLSGLHASRHGEENFTYAAIVSLEELLEMAGVVVFIYALVDYIHRELGGLRIAFGPPPRPVSAR